jgi:hypothetical protein
MATAEVPVIRFGAGRCESAEGIAAPSAGWPERP